MSSPKQLNPRDGSHLTDGEIVFQVPQKYAPAILKALPQLRHSFESLGGIHRGSANQKK